MKRSKAVDIVGILSILTIACCGIVWISLALVPPWAKKSDIK
ncbi:hypothetical protein M2145_002773 [Lachnospiraceae bacterium PF1-21]|nr:hypothetical protein [Ohessyouella blattaphilus]